MTKITPKLPKFNNLSLLMDFVEDELIYFNPKFTDGDVETIKILISDLEKHDNYICEVNAFEMSNIEYTNFHTMDKETQKVKDRCFARGTSTVPLWTAIWGHFEYLIPQRIKDEAGSD